MTLAEFAARAVGEYMRAFPDDPKVVELRVQLDGLRVAVESWRWN